jgi:hypothetical protein
MKKRMGRGRWRKGDEKEEGAEAPSSHENQRKRCIWRRERRELLAGVWFSTLGPPITAF